MSRLPKAEQKVIAPKICGICRTSRNQFLRSLDMTDGQAKTIQTQGEAVYPFAPCLPNYCYTGGVMKI